VNQRHPLITCRYSRSFSFFLLNPLSPNQGHKTHVNDLCYFIDANILVPSLICFLSAGEHLLLRMPFSDVSLTCFISLSLVKLLSLVAEEHYRNSNSQVSGYYMLSLRVLLS
jgi:hypothetical protein